MTILTTFHSLPRVTLALAAAATLALGVPHAEAQDAASAAVKARQSHMQLYAYNLGILGGMARGLVDYDAATAQTAADNLSTLAHMDTRSYWLPGTAMGEQDGSNALPAIWEDGSDIGAKAGDLAAATEALQAAAGSDLAALQGAMGPLGAACSACHKSYRHSDE
ncbi:c-type cytochrome [Celeribacter sp.]|uniref:c-type cytochrome n=1 Tax=Celeribacter sp. TaxID=1890673 RepID=UPI003A93C3F7